MTQATRKKSIPSSPNVTGVEPMTYRNWLDALSNVINFLHTVMKISFDRQNIVYHFFKEMQFPFQFWYNKNI